MKPIIFVKTGMLVLTFSIAFLAEGQGCSDAGFCTLGSFKHGPATEKNYKHRLSVQLPVGTGDENVFVLAPALQYELTLKNLSFLGKLTGNYADGNLGSLAGAGDLFLTASYTFPSQKWTWQGTAGVKIPLDPSNSSENGFPLPLQYQSSLGTFDIIAGLTATNKGWSLSAAIQQPLTKENKNGFLPEFWNGKPEAGNYPPSNRFQRRGDLLFRASKTFSTPGKWQFQAGLLNIYHLGMDRYTAVTPSQRVVAIEGSGGLTINITGGAWYQASKKLRIGISGGTPALARDVRPDGLTRQWVLSPEINWQF